MASASNKSIEVSNAGGQVKPVRNPARRRSSRCTTSLLPIVGLQDNDSRQGEGRLDFDFQIIMSVAPHVIEYREQPETFTWLQNGVWRRYTPDGLAVTTLGKLYCEIKPEKQLQRSPDLKGRLDEIRAQCRERDADFAIMSEEQIRTGCLLANSMRVWSASQEMDQGQIVRACAMLEQIHFPVTLGTVWAVLGDRAMRIANGLVGHKYLALNLNEPLLGTTMVARGRRRWP